LVLQNTPLLIYPKVRLLGRSEPIRQGTARQSEGRALLRAVAKLPIFAAIPTTK
jgi:hypothetical protein